MKTAQWIAVVLMVLGIALLGMMALGISEVFWTWFLTNASLR